MNLLIINCSPRVKAKSNTNIIVRAFADGYTKQGNTVEIYNLSELGKWDEIRVAFYNHENILMALPLFVESIPGIMLEFLETLSPKSNSEGQPKTKLSFLLQGGFSEASQLRCGERYLEQIPGFLNCEYGGTLIKGSMFIIHMLPETSSKQMVSPFIEMGEVFAIDGKFDKEKVNKFAAPEYYSKRFILLHTLLSPLNKLFFAIFFKKNGCLGSLTAQPYKKMCFQKD
ncbi:MAG: hypothetical protein K0S01_3505 [Herbinix sp.]|jgi:multimeric flavodoxin WrbA|nr:hypothetical protein [Herbinix sp.]